MCVSDCFLISSTCIPWLALYYCRVFSHSNIDDGIKSLWQRLYLGYNSICHIRQFLAVDSKTQCQFQDPDIEEFCHFLTDKIQFNSVLCLYLMFDNSSYLFLNPVCDFSHCNFDEKWLPDVKLTLKNNNCGKTS